MAKAVLGKFSDLLSDDAGAAAGKADATASDAAALETVDAISAAEPDLASGIDAEIGSLQDTAAQDSALAKNADTEFNPSPQGKGSPPPVKDNAGTSPGTKSATPVSRDVSPAKTNPVEPRPANESPAAPSCHSFTGTTRVLMTDGSTIPIDQIKVGDHIANAVPGQSATQDNTVTAVIVTTTDHDFVNLDIKPLAAGETPTAAAKTTIVVTSVLKKAAVGLAAAVTALGAATATATGAATFTANNTGQSTTTAAVSEQGGTLTTTFHHPFYDITQTAFIDAQNLKTGDELQTPTGHAVVTGIRLYHANTVTYDLTIGNLHTYYVVAGDTPVLVHNCGDGLKYVTYTKTNPMTGEVYTGRTMGYGDDNAIVAARDAGHHMTAKGFGPAVLDQSVDATLPYADRHADLAYQAIRGREQSLIDFFGGARSMGGTSGNAIQGVGDDNPLRSTYMYAAWRTFGLPPLG